jgi:hypothetical protein
LRSPRYSRFPLGLLLFVLGAGLASGKAFAQPADAMIEDFFGTYEGRAISAADQGLSKRDLSIEIREADQGAFIVDWTTVTFAADGTPKRKSYSIVFRGTRRDSVFGSAMRNDKFGNRIPLDPLRGDPFVWARLRGQTLTVFALVITDEGGYEMQQYDRTLVPGGLDFRFTRLRNGEPLRMISGSLVRLDR